MNFGIDYGETYIDDLFSYHVKYQNEIKNDNKYCHKICDFCKQKYKINQWEQVCFYYWESVIIKTKYIFIYVYSILKVNIIKNVLKVMDLERFVISLIKLISNY